MKRRLVGKTSINCAAIIAIHQNFPTSTFCVIWHIHNVYMYACMYIRRYVHVCKYVCIYKQLTSDLDYLHYNSNIMSGCMQLRKIDY